MPGSLAHLPLPWVPTGMTSRGLLGAPGDPPGTPRDRGAGEVLLAPPPPYFPPLPERWTPPIHERWLLGTE